METKFTKGEWLSRELVVYNSETGQTIAHIGKWSVKTEEEAEANAKLIAKSPVLLKCLRDALNSISDLIRNEDIDVDLITDEQLTEWENAIKEATE